MSTFERGFMQRAIDLSKKGSIAHPGGPAGGPFGAVIVRDGRIIGEGYNRVLADIDPTAHAEIVAIRHACQTVKSLVLDRAAMYASCQPCPMCLGAIMWSRLEAVFYVNTADDARRIGFDDAEFYRELALPEAERRLSQRRVDFPDALNVFEQWLNSPNRRQY